MTTPTSTPEMKPAKSNKMTMYIIVAVIVIIIVGAAVYVLSTQTSTFWPDKTIGLKGNQTTGWNVTSIHVTLNQKIRIALISGDGVTHDFIIAYADNATTVPPPSGDKISSDFSSQTTATNFDFTASTAGTFRFYCQYHNTVMKGTITIS